MYLLMTYLMTEETQKRFYDSPRNLYLVGYQLTLHLFTSIKDFCHFTKTIGKGNFWNPRNLAKVM